MNVAHGWLDRQMTAVLTSLRRRQRKRALLTLAGAAALLGLVTFCVLSLDRDIGAWHRPIAVYGALLVIGASTITAAALYPIWRQMDHWLMMAASAITRDNIDFLSVLGKLTELRNGETAGHNLRVTLYTLMFAEALKLPPQEITRILKGALLHDIGKLAVADHILSRPGPLTPVERAEMAKHVDYGLEIIQQSHVLQAAARVVGAHHERYDGQGYPLGLRGEAIPYEARLFALVDVFDALTSQRVYKPAFSIETALATMAEGRGSHFDPTLFDRFVEHVHDFAQQLPRDDSALTTLLMQRLRPYFELLALEWALPKANNTHDGQAFDTQQVAQGVSNTMPTPLANQSAPSVVEKP